MVKGIILGAPRGYKYHWGRSTVRVIIRIIIPTNWLCKGRSNKTQGVSCAPKYTSNKGIKYSRSQIWSKDHLTISVKTNPKVNDWFTENQTHCETVSTHVLFKVLGKMMLGIHKSYVPLRGPWCSTINRLFVVLLLV